jgi:hypothetical protein
MGSIVKEKISELSDKYGDVEFLVGNNGSFDYISQRALMELALENERIGFCIVLSYIDEKPLIGKTAFTLFPDGQELVPRKFAISRRNDWLLSKADIVLCYVKHVGSNS